MCLVGWPEPPLSGNSSDGPWGQCTPVTEHSQGQMGQPCRQMLSSGLEGWWALLTLLILACPLPCVAGWPVPPGNAFPCSACTSRWRIPAAAIAALAGGQHKPLMWVASLGLASSIRGIASEGVGDHPKPGMG